jgi:spore germination protein GerM
VSVVAGVAVFAAGVILGPVLRERGYELQEWVTRPVTPGPGLETVRLCFADSTAQYLDREERKLLAEDEPYLQIRAVLEELIRGPEQAELVATVPEATEVRSIYLVGGDIVIDFSSSLATDQPGGSAAELLSVYSIVNTLLLNFPAYERVQILVEGTVVETLAGHVDLTAPFRLNPELLVQEPTDNHET